MVIRLGVNLCCPGTRLEECTTASLSLCDVTWTMVKQEWEGSTRRQGRLQERK
jgi:hypothetical protein